MQGRHIMAASGNTPLLELRRIVRSRWAARRILLSKTDDRCVRIDKQYQALTALFAHAGL